MAHRKHAFDVRIWLGLAVFFGVAADSRAVASCGDWLAHGETSPDRAIGRAAVLQSSESINHATRGRQRVPGRPIPSCTNARCGSSPYSPSPAGPADSLNGGNEKAVAVEGELFASAERQFGDHSEFDARPKKGFAQRIEHPPRV